MMRIPSAAWLVSSVAVVGCAEPFDCTQVEIPAAVLTVRDRRSDTPITPGAAAHLRAGTSETAFGPFAQDDQGRTVSLAAYAPNGTYAIAVSHDGYAPWDSVLTVRSEAACQSDRTQHLTARLEPR